jgi:hypothetical protein
MQNGRQYATHVTNVQAITTKLLRRRRRPYVLSLSARDDTYLIITWRICVYAAVCDWSCCISWSCMR